MEGDHKKDTRPRVPDAPVEIDTTHTQRHVAIPAALAVVGTALVAAWIASQAGTVGVAGVSITADNFIPSEAQDVVFALGGTALLTSLLTYLLATTAVPASVAETTYTTLSANFRALASDTGYRETRTYVPSKDGYDVHLLVTKGEDGAANPGSRDGLYVEPSGASMFRDLGEEAVRGDAGMALDALAEAAVHRFELAEKASGETEDGGATLHVTGSAYGSPGGFNHPLTSFVAVGIASHLGEEVRVSDVRKGDGTDYAVVYRWG